jgi:hypothetical protein
VRSRTEVNLYDVAGFGVGVRSGVQTPGRFRHARVRCTWMEM